MPVISNPNIWGQLRDLADKNVWRLANAGAPTSGTSGTGAGLAGPGSLYTNTTTGDLYINTNTKASPTWTLVAATGVDPAFVVVAAGTATSGATTATSIASSGLLSTDIPFVTWRNAPQTIGHISAVCTTDAITVSFAATVGTAGTLNYQVLRAVS